MKRIVDLGVQGVHAAKGEVEDALLFCRANAYKAEKIETVKEVIDSLVVFCV